MAATLSRELATRQRSGGSYTRHPFPPRLLPTAWEATPRRTPSTLACDHLASRLSLQVGTRRRNCRSMDRLAQAHQLGQAAKRRAQNMAAHHCTWLSRADCTGCVGRLITRHAEANGNRAITVRLRAKADRLPSQSLRSLICQRGSFHYKKVSRRQRASSTSHTTTTRTRSLSWR
jgi:hypothetical protein